MKKTKLAALLLCCVVVLAGCGASEPGGGSVPSQQPDAQTGGEGSYGKIDLMDFPRLDGSTANLPLMRALAMHYTGITAEEAEYNISVSTTDYAYYTLTSGYADLLLVYEGSEDTKRIVRESGVAVEQKPIGLDALVFICNEQNKVEGLTTRELQQIYTGEILSWIEVGGEDIEIVPYQRTQLSGSQTMMEKLVMNGLMMMPAPGERRPGGMGGLVDSIASYANTGNALGYSVYYYIKNMYAVQGVKMLNVDGVTPSNQSIQDGSYPFVNEFYALIRADEPPDSLTRQVFDFLTTADGKKLIEQAGYVPTP